MVLHVFPTLIPSPTSLSTQFPWALRLLYSPTLTSICDHWKNHTFDYLDIVGKVMSLLFNMLSRFAIAFLPWSKCLLISWLQSPSAVILEPKRIKFHCFHCFPTYLPWSDGTDDMIFIFWILNVKPAFSLSSFTFIKRLFSSSSLSAMRVVSSAYPRLLIFLPVILTAACAWSVLVLVTCGVICVICALERHLYTFRDYSAGWFWLLFCLPWLPSPVFWSNCDKVHLWLS